MRFVVVLLHGGEREARHNLGVHLADERHCVTDTLIPPRLLPHLFARNLAALQVLVGPDVMDMEEWPNLREHARHTVIEPIADASLPVVSPLDQSAGLECIGPHLVYVRFVALLRLRPVVERETDLSLAVADHLTGLALELAIGLVLVEQIESLRVLTVVLVPKQVHICVQRSDLRPPAASQLAVRVLLGQSGHILFAIFLVVLGMLRLDLVDLKVEQELLVGKQLRMGLASLGDFVATEHVAEHVRAGATGNGRQVPQSTQ